MYLILHAYSRRNAGDGLLVDLTLELLADAGIDRSECSILALDAPSFSDLDHVIQAPGEPAARLSIDVVKAGVEVLLSSAGRGKIDALVRKSKGVVAVGGGYLVADSSVRQLGVLVNHFAQVRAAARLGKPSIYLPQSIGPLHLPICPLLERELRLIDSIYVRDNESLAALPWKNVHRCGDLAVMKLARSLSAIDVHPAGAGSTVIVGRDLPNAGTYRQRLASLAAILEQPIWAVQADSAGKRSDRNFYEEMGVEPRGLLAETLKNDSPSVVVSVRLHGAIAALLEGRPAIHLAYERKGWGAYEDLGIAEYVHDARTFDPELVSGQAALLKHDPTAFWRQITNSAGALQAQYTDLVADVCNRLAS